MLVIIYILTFFFHLYISHEINPDYLPNQVHLSIGEQNSRDIVVVWVTYNDTKESFVEYKSKNNFEKTEGKSTPYEFNQRIEYIHKVVLTNLTPNTIYTYHCGGPTYGWSNIFQFKSWPLDEGWGPRLLLFGDLGVGNAKSLTRIQEEIFQNNFHKDLMTNDVAFQGSHSITKNGVDYNDNDGGGSGQIDAILHVGDFAYDMNDQDGRVGDVFLNEIEPVAGNVPYITCPGNHENNQNFSQYRNKFVMPNAQDMMFSFNMGPVHFISFSTEYYYFVQYGLWQIKKQYEWLENDLIEANKAENRGNRPWIVTFGHRPMYCSNKNVDDCTQYSSRVRTGMPLVRKYGLEDLFYRYGVDVELWAHEHNYERSWPLFNYTVYNGTTSANPYQEPRAPIHIITGSAGCSEEHDPFKEAPSWTGYRSLDYGYTRMWVPNKTHINIQQVSDDQNGKVIDNIWIIKEKREPYPNLIKKRNQHY